MKKYILVESSVLVKKFNVENNTFENVELYQIKAVRDFGEVKEGELGGYIEKEENLSHDSNCWVRESGKVYGSHRIEGDSIIFGEIA